MRRLLLLRHAKAAPAIVGDDYDRPLTERGEEEARGVGELIARKGLIPDLVIYSGSRRTKQTTELVMAGWTHPAKATEDNRIYDATRQLVYLLVRALPASADSVMLVGHNPGMADVASLLAGSGSEHDRLRMAAKFPTSGLAVIEFPLQSWDEVEPRKGELVRFSTP